MIGVIAGDVIGSVYEHERRKSTDFPLFHPSSRFTDDTVLTVATAYAILNGTPYELAYREFGRRYPNAGYSLTFRQWLHRAQATALAVFMARSGATKDEIRAEIVALFDYDLSRTIEEIRPDYQWDVSCQGSVPEAIVAFLDSRDVEHAIRLAISLGGDADTQAAIAGGIAHAYYTHLPDEIVAGVRERLPQEFIDVIDAFDRAYPIRR